MFNDTVHCLLCSNDGEPCPRCTLFVLGDGEKNDFEPQSNSTEKTEQ